MGYNIALFGSDVVRTCAKQVFDYMKELKRERHPLPERMMPMPEFLEFMGASKYREYEDKYIRYAKDLMPKS